MGRIGCSCVPIKFGMKRKMFSERGSAGVAADLASGVRVGDFDLAIVDGGGEVV